MRHELQPEIEQRPNQNLAQKFQKILGRLTLVAGLTLGSAIADISYEVYDADPASAENTYPWDQSGAVDLSPVKGAYTWGYETCLAGMNCNVSVVMDKTRYYYRDPSGYDIRNCTSWAAYRANQLTQKLPSYWGNAAAWDEKAVGLGYAVDSMPEVGDVAQRNGNLGHVGVVEKVNSGPNGQMVSIEVSEYNKSGNGGYSYSTYTRDQLGRFGNWDHYIDLNGTTVVNPALVTPTSYSGSDAMRAADFTGDGYDDIFATSMRGDPAQNEQVFRGGNWLGGGELWATPPASAITYADSINLSADVNGDNKDDLITITNRNGDGSPIIQWQRSTGSSFETPLHVGTPNLISKNTRWITGDVTGDGRDDVIAFSMRGDVGVNMFVFRSLGGWLGGMEYWGATGSDAPFIGSTFLPGDKNGDGKVDLYAVAKHPDRPEPFVYWLRSNGQNFEAPVLTAVPSWNFSEARFTAADLDGDGKTDLLASTKRGDHAPNLQAWLSDGGSSYKYMGLWSAPGELRWADVHYMPADLDKDGDDDIIAIQKQAGGSAPEIWWLRSHGGSFIQPQLVGVPNAQFDQIRFGR